MTETFVDPTREDFGTFAKMPIEGAIQMLNLIKLRAQAVYEDGRKGTGSEAYAAYGAASAPFFKDVGGTIAWRGKPQFTLIGPSDEAWDIGFLAQYPSKAAFLDMISHPDYQAIVFHRQAAVLTSRLQCFAASDTSGTFG